MVVVVVGGGFWVSPTASHSAERIGEEGEGEDRGGKGEEKVKVKEKRRGRINCFKCRKCSFKTLFWSIFLYKTIKYIPLKKYSVISL